MTLTPEDARRYARHGEVAQSRRARARKPAAPEPFEAPVCVAAFALFDDGTDEFSCAPGTERATLDTMIECLTKRREGLTT